MLPVPEKLLLIKPGSMGDVIHALPCVAAIRQAWPQTQITWLVDDRWQPLLEGNPNITSTRVFPRRQFRGLAGLRAVPWALNLRKLRPDLVLDLQGLLRSALMARLSGATRIVGLSDAREGAGWFYTKTTPVVAGEHAVRRYLRSLDSLGIPIPATLDFSLPTGTRPASWTNEQPFILLHPFARGAGKSLTETDVAALCARLQPYPVVVAGIGEMSIALPGNTTNLLGRTSLSEMIWLLRAARFVVSVDSGPMHIAAAVNPRLLSIHTWSDPRLVGPFNEAAWIWQGGQIRRQSLQPGEIKTPVPFASEHIPKLAEWLKAEIGQA